MTRIHRLTLSPQASLLAAALAIAALMAASPAHAQVGVSVSVAQRGVHGRIEIGNQPPLQDDHPHRKGGQHGHRGA